MGAGAGAEEREPRQSPAHQSPAAWVGAGAEEQAPRRSPAHQSPVGVEAQVGARARVGVLEVRWSPAAEAMHWPA